MRSERTKQTFTLQMLAFVLALALLWYSLNPTPGPSARIQREDELPDEKKRAPVPQLRRAASLPIAFRTLGIGSADHALSKQQEEEFHWPEFIDG